MNRHLAELRSEVSAAEQRVALRRQNMRYHARDLKTSVRHTFGVARVLQRALPLLAGTAALFATFRGAARQAPQSDSFPGPTAASAESAGPGGAEGAEGAAPSHRRARRASASDDPDRSDQRQWRAAHRGLRLLRLLAMPLQRELMNVWQQQASALIAALTGLLLAQAGKLRPVQEFPAATGTAQKTTGPDGERRPPQTQPEPPAD